MFSYNFFIIIQLFYIFGRRKLASSLSRNWDVVMYGPHSCSLPLFSSRKRGAPPKEREGESKRKGEGKKRGKKKEEREREKKQRNKKNEKLSRK